MQQITRHVYEVGGSGFSHMSDAAVFLVKDDSSAALIDAGTGKGHDRLLDNIKQTGTELDQIRYIFLTHCHYDHTGGAKMLKEAIGCPVVAHELDAPYLTNGDQQVTAASWYGSYIEPLNIDIIINEKEKDFHIGGLVLTAYHIPGHSPGSLAFLMDSDGQRVLFGQDVHGPLNNLLHSNRNDYINSLEFLISLEPDILCEGHFGIYQGNSRIKGFIESFM